MPDLLQMPIEYGKWFYPHQNQIPQEKDIAFSETVLVSYDPGGIVNPHHFAGDYYDFTLGTWASGETPWCWMYIPPRDRKPQPTVIEWDGTLHGKPMSRRELTTKRWKWWRDEEGDKL